MKLKQNGRPWLVGFVAAALVMMWTQVAHAHMDSGSITGFTGGFVHPWSGMDHIIAMLAVGIWGAQLGKPAIWLLPVTFPLVMALGGFFGLIGVPVPGGESTVEVGVAVSGVILGAMVLASARPPMLIAAVLVGAFGMFHGYAHGHELPAADDKMMVGLLYSIGFVIATGTLHGLGITIGLIHHWSFGKVALRGAGAVIMALGCWCVWAAVSAAMSPAAETMK